MRMTCNFCNYTFMSNKLKNIDAYRNFGQLNFLIFHRGIKSIKAFSLNSPAKEKITSKKENNCPKLINHINYCD